ncbi:hypothetical protein V8C86DRAFT_2753879 [Haematococcus lacustris]
MGVCTMAQHTEPTVPLFCYGSNSSKQLAARTGAGALQPRPAELHGYVRVFAGLSARWQGAVASVHPAPSQVVQGALVMLTAKQLEVLDGYEGGYTRCLLPVRVRGPMDFQQGGREALGDQPAVRAAGHVQGQERGQGQEQEQGPEQEQGQSISNKGWTTACWPEVLAWVYIKDRHEYKLPPSVAYLTAIQVMMREVDPQHTDLHVCRVWAANSSSSSCQGVAALTGHGGGVCDTHAVSGDGEVAGGGDQDEDQIARVRQEGEGQWREGQGQASVQPTAGVSCCPRSDEKEDGGLHCFSRQELVPEECRWQQGDGDGAGLELQVVGCFSGGRLILQEQPCHLYQLVASDVSQGGGREDGAPSP